MQSGRFRQIGDYHLFMSIYVPLELYWTAPEFLGEDAIVRCPQAGDSYSYGIILNELLSREEPYSSLCMDPRGGWQMHYHTSVFPKSVLYLGGVNTS